MLVKDFLCSKNLIVVEEKVKGNEMKKHKNYFLLK